MEVYGMSWQAYAETPEYVIERAVDVLNARAKERALDEFHHAAQARRRK